MRQEIEHFINHFINKIQEDNAAIFAGAGLSAASGYVNWKELLRPLAEDLKLDIETEHDLVSLAQYHLNENGRHGINQRLLNEISTNKQPSENHEILARLPISTYWTTNYDKLIEASLESVDKCPDVKYTENHLTQIRPNRQAIVYKMHGDIDHPDKAVITKDDYERYVIDRGAYVNALAGDLISKTFLFLGFSFSDPNLDYIMARIRIKFEGNQQSHFCIIKKCQREEFKSDYAFSLASQKEYLVIQDLKRYQIKTLLVDSYDEITEILQKIERSYRRKSIFISGSAHDFYPWEKNTAEEFLCNLSSSIVENNYRIWSGMGQGISYAIITGAVKAIDNNHDGQLNDHLHMKPFPRCLAAKERKEAWKKHRYEIIKNAGIAIFFMGNKGSGNRVVLSDGVKEEFRIAHELGLAVIPIGASGHMAKELWKEVTENISRYYPKPNTEILEKIEVLGVQVENPNELIPKITEIIEIISKG